MRAAAAALVVACAPVCAGTAWADPEPQPAPPTESAGATPVAADQPLHNITYRARIDGVARGALITYKINDTQV